MALVQISIPIATMFLFGIAIGFEKHLLRETMARNSA